MTARKYEFTGETRGALKRIRRLSDGLVGGWIESERNLDHEGKCFIYDSAVVSGSAVVRDSAVVCDSADIKTASRSDGYTFTLLRCADDVWRLTAGCRFFTMDEAWRHWMTTRGDRDDTLGAETLDILWLFDRHIERREKRA